jgi:hypothetical protein
MKLLGILIIILAYTVKAALFIKPLLVLGSLVLIQTISLLHALHGILIRPRAHPDSLAYRWKALGRKEQTATAFFITAGLLTIVMAVVVPSFFPKIALFMHGILFKGTALAMSVKTCFIGIATTVATLAAGTHIARLLFSFKVRPKHNPIGRIALAKRGLSYFFGQIKAYRAQFSDRQFYAFIFFSVVVPAGLLSFAYALPAFHAFLSHHNILGISAITLLTAQTIMLVVNTWMTHLTRVLASQPARAAPRMDGRPKGESHHNDLKHDNENTPGTASLETLASTNNLLHNLRMSVIASYQKKKLCQTPGLKGDVEAQVQQQTVTLNETRTLIAQIAQQELNERGNEYAEALKYRDNDQVSQQEKETRQAETSSIWIRNKNLTRLSAQQPLVLDAADPDPADTLKTAAHELRNGWHVPFSSSSVYSKESCEKELNALKAKGVLPAQPATITTQSLSNRDNVSAQVLPQVGFHAVDGASSSSFATPSHTSTLSTSASQ